MSGDISDQNVGMPSQPVTDELYKALTELLLTGTDPDFLEAQRIMLRRMALQGDIAKSRIPAPQNITEIGGYLNLVQELEEKTIQGQMLAGALGVAGPDISGVIEARDVPSVTFVRVDNQRPASDSGVMIPNTILIRQDLQYGFERMRSEIRSKGCALPLSSPRRLPLSINQIQPTSGAPLRVEVNGLFPIIGRRLRIAEGLLFRDPAADSIVVANRTSNATDKYRLLAATSDASVASHNWQAIKFDTSNGQITTVVVNRAFVSLQEVFVKYGWLGKEGDAAPITFEEANGYANLDCDENLVSCISAGTPPLGSELATRLEEELGELYLPRELAAWRNANLLKHVWCKSVSAFIDPSGA